MTDTILLTVAGSRAYGTHRPDSDIDLKGVCFADPEVYLGFTQSMEQIEDTEKTNNLFRKRCGSTDLQKIADDHGVEGSVYEIRKFFRLASNANPNILDTLFCRDEEVIYASTEGKALRDMAHDFLSAKAKHTFSGYARAQLKRIKTHRKWILHPIQGPPTRTEYGLPERTLLPKEELAALRAAVQKRMDEWELDLDGMDPARRQHVMDSIETTLVEIMATTDDKWIHAARSVGLDDNIIEVMGRERKYITAKRNWKQFQHWKKSRNPDRALLEEKYLYDTKHASHLFRLQNMGHEILSTGQVHVWRGDRDAETLMDIRNGEWSYDCLVEWATAKEAETTALYNAMYNAMYHDHTVESVLPREPDLNKLDEACQQLVLMHVVRNRTWAPGWNP